MSSGQLPDLTGRKDRFRRWKKFLYHGWYYAPAVARVVCLAVALALALKGRMLAAFAVLVLEEGFIKDRRRAHPYPQSPAATTKRHPLAGLLPYLLLGAALLLAFQGKWVDSLLLLSFGGVLLGNTRKNSDRPADREGGFSFIRRNHLLRWLPLAAILLLIIQGKPMDALFVTIAFAAVFVRDTRTA